MLYPDGTCVVNACSDLYTRIVPYVTSLWFLQVDMRQEFIFYACGINSICEIFCLEINSVIERYRERGFSNMGLLSPSCSSRHVFESRPTKLNFVVADTNGREWIVTAGEDAFPYKKKENLTIILTAIAAILIYFSKQYKFFRSVLTILFKRKAKWLF